MLMSSQANHGVFRFGKCRHPRLPFVARAIWLGACRWHGPFSCATASKLHSADAAEQKGACRIVYQFSPRAGEGISYQNATSKTRFRGTLFHDPISIFSSCETVALTSSYSPYRQALAARLRMPQPISIMCLPEGFGKDRPPGRWPTPRGDLGPFKRLLYRWNRVPSARDPRLSYVDQHGGICGHQPQARGETGVRVEKRRFGA